MTTNKKLWKNIILISLIALLLFGATFYFTYALFNDKKEGNVTINVATLTPVVSTAELSPEDLIANNEFTKTITADIETDFDIYLRVYAIVTMQTYNESGEREDRTDLVNVTNVTNSIKGDDNKYYYTTSQNPTSVGDTNLSFTFTFKVSPFVSEDLYTDANFNVDTNLKTTITYHFEYCQAIDGALTDWVNVQI